jgi:hypothetical protein
MNEIQARAIPGVKCGKCLGRISEADNEFSRETQARVRPGHPWVPPSVCCACVIATIMAWPDEDDEDPRTRGKE